MHVIVTPRFAPGEAIPGPDLGCREPFMVRFKRIIVVHHIVIKP